MGESMITSWWVGAAFAADVSVLDAVKLAAEYRALRVAPAPPQITEAEYLKAASGEVVTGLLEVPGVAARKAYGVTVMDVDIATLWSGINDETGQPGWTAISHSEVVSGKMCGDGRKTLQFLPIPMVTDRWWITILDMNMEILQQSGGSVRETSWSSSVDPTLVTSATGKAMIAQGMPLGWTKGGWFLVRLDAARTLVEYYVWSDPGGSVPAGMMSWFAASSVTDALDAVEKFSKEGSPRCPKE